MKNRYIQLLSLWLLLIWLICLAPKCKGGFLKFKDEYPGITVCQSTMSYEKSTQYIMNDSFSFLRAHFLSPNCTHIEGNVIIANIWPATEDGPDPDLSFLQNVVEISGMLVMRNNSIDQIILPNLRVIRGEKYLNKRWRYNQIFPVSLFIDIWVGEGIHHLALPKVTHTLLPSLRVVQNNSVIFHSQTELPNNFSLPHSVNWNELFEDTSRQRLLTVLNGASTFSCHNTCDTWPKGNQYCWSNSEEHCQHRTKCVRLLKHGCNWCSFNPQASEDIREQCCHSSCIGGCDGNKNSMCNVCRNYLKDKSCVNDCEEPNSADSNIRWVKVDRICAKSCQENLVLKNDVCIYTCPWPDYKVGQECRPCYDPDKCGGKRCNTQLFIDAGKHNNGNSFFLTGDMLSNLSGCVHLVGQLHLTEHSFNPNQGAVTVNMLYQHLSKLETITGDLLIQGSPHVKLTNLTFLANLQKINKIGVISSGSAAFQIFDLPSLEFLGLQKLRIINGDVFEENNKRLCYWNTIPWDEKILRNTRFPHKHIEPDNCKNLKCDPACQGDTGCWGPTNRFCVECRHIRAGDRCVQHCEDAPGYYTRDAVLSPSVEVLNSVLDSVQTMDKLKSKLAPYDDKRCAPCNRLCGKSGCSGPSVKDCIDCRFYQDNGLCVQKCPRTHYADANNVCRKCSNVCLNVFGYSVCSGNNRNMGDNGCTFCKAFIETSSENVTVIGKDIIKRLNCTTVENHSGYYLTKLNTKLLKNNYPTSIAVLYKRCQYPCAKCQSLSLRYPQCSFCNRYWSREVCVTSCTNIKNSSSLASNGTCPDCHLQCREGCSRPLDNTACYKCLKFKLYVNVTKFQCLSKCPDWKNFTYLESETKDRRCVSKEELQAQNDIKYKQQINKIIVILIVAFLLCVVFILLSMKKLRSRSYLKQHRYLAAFYSNIQEPDSKTLLLNKNERLLQPNMNRLKFIPTTDLIFNINGKRLGQGAFGDVFKGVWRVNKVETGRIGSMDLDVAIKVINGNTYGEIEEIFKEAKVMASVSHRHCLRLIGVCLYHEKLCLVSSFMPLGSLDKYLSLHYNKISSYHMLHWTDQIANGMAYLEMRGIIHRDLAARNVLLQNDSLVQITDFGLAKMLQGTEEGSEIVITSGKVPIRWLAVETITNGVYSHKTDVWAFGVTVWEILSYGKCPYSEMSLKDIPSYIIQGNRLMQPDICSLELYMLLMRCWADNPLLRPSFENLMTLFSNFSRSSTYYINIINDPSFSNPVRTYSFGRRQYNYRDKRKKKQENQLPHIPRTQQQLLEMSLLYETQMSTGTAYTNLDEYHEDTGSTKTIDSTSMTGVASANYKNCEKRFPLLQNDSTITDDSNYLEPIKMSPINEEYLEPYMK